MPILVFDEGFRFYVRSVMQNTGSPPSMKVEFCSGTESPYFTTTEVKGYYAPSLNTISLFTVCSELNAIRPCTHVNWRRIDNDSIVYKVIYTTALPANVDQISHIVLNIETSQTDEIRYTAVPTNLLEELISVDTGAILSYQLKRYTKGTPQDVPEGELYGYLIDVDFSEDPEQVVYTTDVRVNLSNNRLGRLCTIFDSLFIEVLD